MQERTCAHAHHAACETCCAYFSTAKAQYLSNHLAVLRWRAVCFFFSANFVSTTPHSYFLLSSLPKYRYRLVTQLVSHSSGTNDLRVLPFERRSGLQVLPYQRYGTPTGVPACVNSGYKTQLFIASAVPNVNSCLIELRAGRLRLCESGWVCMGLVATQTKILKNHLQLKRTLWHLRHEFQEPLYEYLSPYALSSPHMTLTTNPSKSVLE